ncbi:SpoIIIAH-like family protein [Clostridium sp. P21]|uniref:SpoIIIAH-like family protein n=1 Tax=Clostridium muellerianum TaxID=2716538 RepID=A0A7Y0EDA9_9CLOT|nr:SpoIIIAH-like family protein [Clostridium muellerianum]NMM61376.1 SpoIIIAH-like family protein [Clostridium muellerianum]
MNKKQAVIIVALLALIVCAGVLATKLNNPLYVNGGDSSNGKSTIALNKDDSKDNKNQFFEEAKLTRDNKNAQTLQTLKTFIDDKNVSKDKKDEASKKYTDLAMSTNYESKIETTLKSKGYEDVICSIEGGKARLVVKAKDKLTDKDTRDMKNVVMEIAQIKEVEIETK